MSRYYFHIRDGNTLVQDEEGMECRDLIAVSREAARSAAELALLALKSGSPGSLAIIEIKDEDGNIISSSPPRGLH